MLTVDAYLVLVYFLKTFIRARLRPLPTRQQAEYKYVLRLEKARVTFCDGFGALRGAQVYGGRAEGRREGGEGLGKGFRTFLVNFRGLGMARLGFRGGAGGGREGGGEEEEREEVGEEEHLSFEGFKRLS